MDPERQNKQKMKSRNKLRTKLLIMENDEINRIKKTNFTQINSKNLSEFEKFYTNLNNNNTIELKEEKFVSRDFTDIIQQNNFKQKFTLKSPDGNNLKFTDISKGITNENDHFNKLDNCKNCNVSDDKKVVFLENLGIEKSKISNKFENAKLKKFQFNRKKSLISSKKNLFFSMTTLKKQNNVSTESETDNLKAFIAPKISKKFFILSNFSALKNKLIIYHFKL